MINDFHANGHEFLSNFYPCSIQYEGLKYPSVEHAFQAAKTLDNGWRVQIRSCLSPSHAKKMGRIVTLRPDWEQAKLSVMLELLRKKFTYPDLEIALLATGDHELVEGNYWNDTYWGVCKSVGTNHLGKLLMQVRKELKDATTDIPPVLR